MKNRLLPAFIIFIAAFLVYSNTLKHGFVWDDHIVIEGNPFLQDPANFKKLISPSFFTEVQSVQDRARPVFLLSLLVDRAVWGAPGGYHLTNVILHGFNSALVFLLGLSVFASSVPAFIAGLLFAVHPVNTEAVNMASFRADILAMFFTLLAFLGYIRFRLAAKNAFKLLFLAGSAVMYAMGLLSKEMAVTLPVLALAWDLLIAGPRELGSAGKGRRLPVWSLAALAVCAAVAMGYLGFRAPRSGYRGIEAAESASGRTERPAPSPQQWSAIYENPAVNFMTMSGVFADYFRLMVFPHPLEADRAPRVIRNMRSPRLWLSWAVLAFLIWAAVRLRKGHPAASFGIMWCFIALLPVSNIVHIYNPMAERYLYMVSAGACIALGHALFFIGGKIHVRREFAALTGGAGVLALLLILPYGLRTYIRNADWRSDAELFAGDGARAVENARVHFNAGLVHQKEGRVHEAMELYRRALAVRPLYAEAMTNLAVLLEDQGDESGAFKLLEKAVSQNPDTPVPYDRLAGLFEKKGDFDRAIMNYKAALTADDGFIPARMHLAYCYVKRGRYDDAIREYGEVKKLDPSHADAYYNLGMLYDDRGKPAKALDELKKVVSLDPGNADASLNMGVIYHHTGKPEAALKWMKKAASLNPRFAAIHYNMGIVLSDIGRLEDSAGALEKAVELKSDYADASYSLAVVYQRLGRTGDAIEMYRQTLKIKPRRLEALNNLGGLYEITGDLERAEETLLKALDIDPSRPGVHNNLGNIYLKRGKIEKAVVEYLRAIEYGPKYKEPPANTAPPRTNLGICYLRQGRVDDAIAQWQTSISVNPRYLNAYYQLADVYGRTDRRDEARMLWRRVLEINPGDSNALKSLNQ